MNLKKKILVGYGVAFTLMGLVVTWAILNLWSLGQTTDAILHDYYRSILAVEDMQDALARQDSAILLMFIGDIDKGVTQYRDNEILFMEGLDRAKKSITVQGESEVVLTIEKLYRDYHRQFAILTNNNRQGGPAYALTLETYNNFIFPVFNQVRTTCLKLRNMNEKTMYTVSEKAGKIARRAIWSTLLVASAASVLALIFSLVFAEKLVLPLRRFVDAAKKITTGEYSVQLSVETTDELGQLAVEFNRMTAQLRQYHLMNVHRIVAEKNKADAILASIEDGLVVFDTEHKVTGINPAGRRILNIDFNEKDVLYCEQILPGQDICGIIAETITTGNPPEVPEDLRIITFQWEGITRHYLFSVTAIGQSTYNLSGVVLLLKDITQLREVERLKSEFVMAASHELRTPLTSLGMGIDLLLEHAVQFLPVREEELLRAAHDEVHRMKTMVHDLLDLAKIETGKFDLELESIPVAALFEHARNIFKGQVSMKHILLYIDNTEDLPPVRADANKIVWVLSNLVSNALRYVGQGSYIRLTAKRMGVDIHISVMDDGIGIPAEHQTRIFQKFVQVNKHESGRTGLGLAISKELVRAHGGTIWVESIPGKGSNFTFTIPVYQCSLPE
jgi:NtrC-family two-component system sensor histidine kinase KinB